MKLADRLAGSSMAQLAPIDILDGPLVLVAYAFLGTVWVMGLSAYCCCSRRRDGCAVRERKLRRKLKVCLVGGGIGGSSAAHHLREKLGKDSLDLTVIEKTDRIGGRVKCVKMFGSEYETGGTMISELNQYMIGFMKLSGGNVTCYWVRHFATNQLFSFNHVMRDQNFRYRGQFQGGFPDCGSLHIRTPKIAVGTDHQFCGKLGNPITSQHISL